VPGRALGRIVGVIDFAQALLLQQRCLLDAKLRLELVELLDDLQIALDIVGAEGVSALEHHVFEQVSDPRDARALVGGAELGDPAGGDVGVAGARHHQ